MKAIVWPVFIAHLAFMILYFVLWIIWRKIEVVNVLCSTKRSSEYLALVPLNFWSKNEIYLPSNFVKYLPFPGPK